MSTLILALALTAQCPGGYCPGPMPRVQHTPMVPVYPVPVVRHVPYAVPVRPYHAPAMKHKFAVKHGFRPFKKFFGGCGR